MLARKGYPSSVVFQVVREELGATDDEGDVAGVDEAAGKG
jgi:hypothetical protein